MSNQTEFIPSASVLLLRVRDNILEVLLLKKNANISFGGSWVFPGGRVDKADTDGLDDDSQAGNIDYAAECQAVVRECEEETGLKIDINQLLPISCWKTPVIRPKRFTTVFFIYHATHLDQDIKIDHGEIVDAKWLSVSQALQQHNERQIMLAGPAFVTLSLLRRQNSIEAVWRLFQQRGFSTNTPKIQLLDNGAISLYHGDDAYELLDAEQTSADLKLTQKLESVDQRHRLYMYKDRPWVYIDTDLGINTAES